jgi:hypothetical protein
MPIGNKWSFSKVILNFFKEICKDNNQQSKNLNLHHHIEGPSKFKNLR